MAETPSTSMGALPPPCPLTQHMPDVYVLASRKGDASWVGGRQDQLQRKSQLESAGGEPFLFCIVFFICKYTGPQFKLPAVTSRIPLKKRLLPEQGLSKFSGKRNVGLFFLTDLPLFTPPHCCFQLVAGEKCYQEGFKQYLHAISLFLDTVLTLAQKKDK